jgi:hypothetical protein
MSWPAWVVFMLACSALLVIRDGVAIVILRRRGKRVLAPPDPLLIQHWGSLLLCAGCLCTALAAGPDPNATYVGPLAWVPVIVAGTLFLAGLVILGLAGWVTVRTRRSAPEGKHARR